jgi:hypothetical protein
MKENVGTFHLSFSESSIWISVYVESLLSYDEKNINGYIVKIICKIIYLYEMSLLYQYGGNSLLLCTTYCLIHTSTEMVVNMLFQNAQIVYTSSFINT